jgi:tRNA-specific 2-thiouridylase
MDALGCDVLATGHHARVAGPAGDRSLLMGLDPAKDQSYVLHMLTQDQLDRVRLPIGEMTKTEVRAHATRLGLRTASKPDSQDLCFVAGDYRDFIRERFPEADRPGEVVDGAGTVVGHHNGTTDFTIGQRRGLGVAVGEARFVVSVDPVAGRVVIGPRAELMSAGCDLEGVSWVSGSAPVDAAVSIKLRYRSPAVPARLERAGDGWRVWFDDPQEAVAAGQAGVVYAGDRVLGGGTIAAAVQGVLA